MRMRRVKLPTCRVMVEGVPWAKGKCHPTTSYLGSWRVGQIASRGRQLPPSETLRHTAANIVAMANCGEKLRSIVNDMGV